MNAAACHHARACYAQREVDATAYACRTGSHVVIEVQMPGAPPTVLEYIVDTRQPEDAVRVGMHYAREFIDGSLH